MLEAPETRFAVNREGAHIAFQTVGQGPPDLVFVDSWFTHVDYPWEVPGAAAFARRLASFSRLVLFDKRGMGASDPLPGGALPTLEEWVDDVQVVMDTVGSQRAALCGFADGGLMAMVFAATHPERTTALVLVETTGRFSQSGDWSLGLGAPIAARREQFMEQWGTRGATAYLDLAAPSASEVERYWLVKLQRMAASPSKAAAIYKMLGEMDVRGILGAIRVPTLVIHRSGDRWLPVENGRYLAEHIAGARFVEIAGADHWYWLGDQEAVLCEIEEFLTGVRQRRDADRVLATVLFTDISASTERAAAMGDQQWRALLEQYRSVVRQQLQVFRGREINTRGDDFLATFDGPARAIRCAQAVADAAQSLGLDVRSGLHTGEIELMGDDVGGIAVHIGARVSEFARAGEVLVSGVVPPLVAGSGIEFADRGEHGLKGVPGNWRIFAVTG